MKAPRKNLLALALATLAAACLAQFQRHPDQTAWVPLFPQPVTPVEVRIASADLTRLQIPYRLSPQRNAVLVPPEQQEAARLTLASSGLPLPQTEGLSRGEKTETDRKTQKLQRLLDGVFPGAVGAVRLTSTLLPNPGRPTGPRQFAEPVWEADGAPPALPRPVHEISKMQVWVALDVPEVKPQMLARARQAVEAEMALDSSRGDRLVLRATTSTN